MGQLISFHGKSDQVHVSEQGVSDVNSLVSVLPYLKTIQGDTILIKIDPVKTSQTGIEKICQEIVIMQHMNINSIVILDIDEYILKHASVSDHEKIFKVDQDARIDGTRVLDAITKIGGLGVILSGADSNIMFNIGKDEKVVNHNDTYHFAKNNERHFNIDIIRELNKTNLIPILIPICFDRSGKIRLMETDSFIFNLTSHADISKVVINMSTQNENLINKIHTLSRFERILASNALKFDEKTNNLLNNCVNIIKNGVESVHIINGESMSLINEICIQNVRGTVLYDDVQHTL